MRANQSSSKHGAFGLEVQMEPQTKQQPMPVQIRVIGNIRPATVVLSARMSRPRRGQNTRKAVEPAPRQI